jgi:hypothetical protein
VGQHHPVNFFLNLQRLRDRISISSRCTRLLIDYDDIDTSQPASAN